MGYQWLSCQCCTLPFTGRAPRFREIETVSSEANLEERLEKLIAEYNDGSLNIDVLFKELVEFTQDLNEETQRHIRESLAEEELAIFDILTRPDMELTQKETDDIKQICRDLLNTLKAEKLVVTVVRDATGPTQVILAEEDSTLWRGVKAHIGARDPLWRYISHWKQALLDKCQARASLNGAIRNKAEQDFGMPVLWGTGHHGPYLAASMVGWARAAVSRVALGEQFPEINKEFREVEGGRPRGGLVVRLSGRGCHGVDSNSPPRGGALVSPAGIHRVNRTPGRRSAAERATKFSAGGSWCRE